MRAALSAVIFERLKQGDDEDYQDLFVDGDEFDDELQRQIYALSPLMCKNSIEIDYILEANVESADVFPETGERAAETAAALQAWRGARGNKAVQLREIALAALIAANLKHSGALATMEAVITQLLAFNTEIAAFRETLEARTNALIHECGSGFGITLD